jgi:hypothetical protein
VRIYPAHNANNDDFTGSLADRQVPVDNLSKVPYFLAKKITRERL